MSIILINSNSVKIPLADKSVQMVCTSPPYWGLRAYSTGDNKAYELGSEPLHDCLGWAKGEPPCGKCFVCNLRTVFAEVWRVLRSDGVVFCNLGDTYAQSQIGRNMKDTMINKTGGNVRSGQHCERILEKIPIGLKPKDLCLMPARVALALQADGWYVRSEVIWAKRNPMPESVTDRPAKAHEQIYLLTKSERYFYDAQAVAESSIHAGEIITNNGGKNGQMGKFGQTRTGFMKPEGVTVASTRNLRTVWSLATEPTSLAHFAVFPTEIPRRCIKAGSPEAGSCSKCGAPWERVVEPTKDYQAILDKNKGNYHQNRDEEKEAGAMRSWGDARQIGRGAGYTTTGHRPTCACNAPARPAIILDPFAGSGTTGQVARELGRHFVGLDLSYHYLHDIARARLELDRLEAWTNGAAAAGDVSDLPLFGGLKP